MPLEKRFVQFRVRDIYLPDPAEVALDLYGGLLLRGTVIDESEGPEGTYVAVLVEGVDSALVVPSARLVNEP